MININSIVFPQSIPCLTTPPPFSPTAACKCILLQVWFFIYCGLPRLISPTQIIPIQYSIRPACVQVVTSAMKAVFLHVSCDILLLVGCSDRCYQATRVGTLIVATIYLQLIQNRYMFRSFTVLQCSYQHCVQPVASDVEVVGYL